MHSGRGPLQRVAEASLVARRRDPVAVRPSSAEMVYIHGLAEFRLTHPLQSRGDPAGHVVASVANDAVAVTAMICEPE